MSSHPNSSVGSERRLLPGQRDRVDDGVAGGAELALLVVLAVLGQVALRHDPEHAPAVDHDGGVEQRASTISGAPTTITGADLAAGGEQLADRVPHGVEQRLLVEEVLDRVAGEAELREGDHAAPGLGARPGASAIVRSTLNSGSAILTFGTAAATRTKPWA